MAREVPPARRDIYAGVPLRTAKPLRRTRAKCVTAGSREPVQLFSTVKPWWAPPPCMLLCLVPNSPTEDDHVTQTRPNRKTPPYYRGRTAAAWRAALTPGYGVSQPRARRSQSG